ncbi:tetratricopeptide repeat protein [Mesorhizobium sp. IMUNJ 23232]|uniref:tetratricopeptide repeat protein n=1 Tax=Mesorhizobium sp. IMUNJ 23232 TaxID=3376064 RepID=UPI0037A7AABD
MKIYIEIPNNFIVDTYLDHVEIRGVYQKIIAAAVDSRLDVILQRPHSYRINEHDSFFNDGLYYTYHNANLGPNAYCVKAGALPGRWYFDRCGYSGWSSMAIDTELQEQSAEFDLGEADQVISLFKAKFEEDNLSRLRQPSGDIEPEISAYGDFIFYPLQVNSDEVLKLGEFPQFEIVGKLAELALRHERHVVLKRHPLCESEVIDGVLANLADHPFIHVSRASIHPLIASCRAVLVSNSGVGVEALVHGKQVFSLARSEYAHMTCRLSALDDLQSVLLYQPAEQTEKVRRQLGYLINEFWVDVTREDQIAHRMQEHMASFQAAVPQPDEAVPASTRQISALARAQKELADVADLLLASYPMLNDGQKEKVAPILARVANDGLKFEAILRNTDARVWRRSMHHFRKRGDLETAERLARKVIGQRSDDSEANLFLSRVYVAKGRLEEAFAAATAAVECDEPTADALAYFARRILVMSKTNSQRALSYAERALAMNPKISLAHFVKAKALLVEGDLVGAFESSASAVDLAPDHIPYVNLKDSIARKMERIAQSEATQPPIA